MNASRTCRCVALGLAHRPEQCAGWFIDAPEVVETVVEGQVEYFPWYDEGGEG